MQRCLFLTGLLLTAGCGGSAGPTALTAAEVRPVLEQYAKVVFANYDAAVLKVTEMRTSIAALLASPTAATLAAARNAWNEARRAYMPSEAFRFYGGPIDADVDGPEGRINAWPIDENYIDYVSSNAGAGIINDAAAFPALTKAVVAEQNEKGGEKNISTGFHAIEFLLWGQDADAAGPGARPHTDYVTGTGGTASNQTRRAQYLSLVTELLLEDLTKVRDAWAPGAAGGYAGELVAVAPVEGVRRMLTGIATLAGGELSHERMQVPYETKDKEDEHSCFSDTTHLDHQGNAQGIANVYLGQYGALRGVGLSSLVAARDSALDTRVKAAISAAQSAIAAIPAPFDQAILGDDSAPGRQKIAAALVSLAALTRALSDVAASLGVTLNL